MVNDRTNGDEMVRLRIFFGTFALFFSSWLTSLKRFWIDPTLLNFNFVIFSFCRFLLSVSLQLVKNRFHLKVPSYCQSLCFISQGDSQWYAQFVSFDMEQYWQSSLTLYSCKKFSLQTSRHHTSSIPHWHQSQCKLPKSESLLL